MKSRIWILLTLLLQTGLAHGEGTVITSFEPYAGDDLVGRLQTPVCRKYLEIAHNGPDKNPLSVDQLQVYKNGFLVDQYYRPGVFTPAQFHVMMSASKPVTATILDAAIQMGLRYKGRALTYDTPLSDFYSYADRLRGIDEINLTRKASKRIALAPDDRRWYEAITLRHLVRMQAGFKWDESYDNPLGDFMSALYLDGIQDIVRASLAVPMERPPGQKFNYSGGNANIIQGIIRLLGRENWGLDDANQIARKVLFSRLGIRDAFFEQDVKGSSIGSTYLYLKPEGIARLGHLYLNRGYWTDADGRVVRILSEEFVAGLTTLNSAVDRAEISDEYLEYLRSQGAPSESITWLNQDLVDRNGAVRYAKEFPHSPDDMFFLAGHNGQVILILPSQQMVIAMTGNNKSYWDKVDKLASYAATCFSDLQLAPDLKKTSLRLPNENEGKKFFLRKWLDGLGQLGSVVGPALQLLNSPIATGVVAKELCSCLTNSLGGSDVGRAIKYCPGDVPQFLQKLYGVDWDARQGVVKVTSLTGGYVREAKVAGEYGCRLEPNSSQSSSRR